MRYLVTYEMPGRHAEYPPLIAVLRALRATRVMTSAWIVESALPAFDVSRHIIAVGCLSQTDRILVVALAPQVDAAWRMLAVADAAMPTLLGHAPPAD